MLLLDLLGFLYEALQKKTWIGFPLVLLVPLILATAVVIWSALT